MYHKKWRQKNQASRKMTYRGYFINDDEYLVVGENDNMMKNNTRNNVLNEVLLYEARSRRNIVINER